MSDFWQHNSVVLVNQKQLNPHNTAPEHYIFFY
jgi:Fe-S cluster biosynthesis and repair protein YggX